MSAHTADLLKAFDALPEEEKRIFTVEFLLRSIPVPLLKGAKNGTDVPSASGT